VRGQRWLRQVKRNRFGVPSSLIHPVAPTPSQNFRLDAPASPTCGRKTFGSSSSLPPSPPPTWLSFPQNSPLT
jgi:hypothetical protein